MTSELKPDLSSFGYADGGYMSKCSHCKETFLGAKRSWSCEPCAIKKSLEPKIEQPKPDVPELVRYRLNSLGELVYSENGQYVLHSQAAAIIAAKDAERNKDITAWRDVFDSMHRRAMEAEAKLAQYEAQEPVAWMHPEAGWTDVCKVTVANHCKHGIEPLPLYASPAPAADLKAENERLLEALKPLVDHAKERNAEGLEWLNSDTVRIPVTIGELRSALNVEASHDKG